MYAISATREVRALYYAFEYGVRGAHKLLAQEPKGLAVVRTTGGTAGRTCGLYATKATASKQRDRIMTAAAWMAGKLNRGCCGTSLIEIVRSSPADFAAVRNVRPLAIN